MYIFYMENNMKIKRLFTLAALLASSLAGAIDMSDLQDQYYAGLNFGGGYGNGGMSLRPNIVIGYHLDKISKLELEFGGQVSFSPTSIALNPMLNYRFYPDLDLDPVSLYVSAGLGGSFNIGSTAKDPGPDDNTKSLASDDNDTSDSVAAPVPQDAVLYTAGGGGLSLNNILGKIAYKLKVGVDYAFTPQIIGAAGLMAGGTLFNIKNLDIPIAVLELGIRYNF